MLRNTGPVWRNGIVIKTNTSVQNYSKAFPLPTSSGLTELATCNGKHRHILHSQSPVSGYSHLLIATGEPQVTHNEHAAGEVGGLDRTGKVLCGHFGWDMACLLAMTEKEEGMVSQGCQTSFTPKLKLQCKRTDPQLELIHTHTHRAACSRGGEKTQYFDLPRAEGKGNKAADKRSRWKRNHFSQAMVLPGCSYYLCI